VEYTVTAKVDSVHWNLKMGTKYPCEVSSGGIIMVYRDTDNLCHILTVTAARKLFDEKELFLMVLAGGK